MALSFKLYTDAALTTEQVGNLVATQNSDGSTPPIQFQLFIGSLGSTGLDVVDRKLEADSDPGVDSIVLTVTDSAPGSGSDPAETKLALTQGGLAAATPGAGLSLATVINSGSANSVEFWVEFDDTTNVVGTSTELAVTTVPVRETDI